MRVLQQWVRPALAAASSPLTVAAWDVPGEPVGFDEAAKQTYAPTGSGRRWGRPWGTTWFHVVGEVPASWIADDRHTIELAVDLGFSHDRPGFQCEGLVHDAAGRILKAVEPRNRAVRLDARGGDPVEFYVEGAANPDVAGGWSFAPTTLGDPETAGSEPLYEFGGAVLVLRDHEVAGLAADIEVLLGLVGHLPDDRPRHVRICAALERAVGVLDPADVAGTAALARTELAAVLAAPAAASAHRIVATGHAHIDCAWLWPTRETIRKCARTFANVLDLMDADPDFVFSCSSAQQFAWVQQHYPELFARILGRVREGRFVPVGGMWVESDTNMPGSEALVRQFVEGGAYFRDQLGVESREVWLPDSFGYSAGLPQIAVRAGARWLLTQKMSWNDTNRMPHHTFWWEGIDGTRIFTHFPPADTYVSDLSIADLDRAERQFSEKAHATVSLLPFGYGDGGGGPTREMLAAAARVRDLEGAPRVEVGTAESFFQRAEHEYGEHAPRWVGEMYLELHRGVYTSQARTKLGNRRVEQALHDAELWATTAMVRRGTEYPAEELRELWQTVLLQQFHDILPGSSIAWVHREAERNYDIVLERAAAVTGAALAALAGEGDDPLWVRSASMYAEAVTPMTVSAIAPPGAVVPTQSGSGQWVLDNGRLRVTIGPAGTVESLVDLSTGREYVPAGMSAAVPQLLPDTPTMWDAWDVDLLDRGGARDISAVESVAVVDRDSLPELEVRRAFGASQLVQRYRLHVDSAALAIDVEVDWQESQRMLKLSFPVDVLAERYAAQTQFGHVWRPLHDNTTWESAKFEVCAHRFVHVGDGGDGVSLVNTRTYGHDVSRIAVGNGVASRLRASLLRAPRFPDPGSDRGWHEFGFRLVVGDIAAAAEHGYEAAAPARFLRGAREVPPLITVEGNGVVVETVKAAQDGTGDVIARIYECHGRRTAATVVPSFAVVDAVETDLHERAIGALDRMDDRILVSLDPFSVRTLRLTARKTDLLSSG